MLTILGGGAVGRAVMRRAMQLRLPVVGFADSGGALDADAMHVYGGEITGLDKQLHVQHIIDLKLGKPHFPVGYMPLEVLPRGPGHVLVDCTACDTPEHVRMLLGAQEAGGAVVLANKHPVAGSQEDFDALTAGRLGYEATVGAATPMVATVRRMRDAGEDILHLRGCLSGSVGAICTWLEEGQTLRQAVQRAQEAGFTEPDPGQDLSGLDVARKAVILARTAGWRVDGLDAVDLKPFRPDNVMHVPRYVATIEPRQIRVRTQDEADTMLGALTGTDNGLEVSTFPTYANSLFLRGAGAGDEATATAVLADVRAVLDV